MPDSHDQLQQELGKKAGRPHFLLTEKCKVRQNDLSFHMSCIKLKLLTMSFLQQTSQLEINSREKGSGVVLLE